MKVLWYKTIVRVRGNAVVPVEEHWHEETAKQSGKGQLEHWSDGATAEVWAIGIWEKKELKDWGKNFQEFTKSGYDRLFMSALKLMFLETPRIKLIASYRNENGTVKESTDA